MNFFQSKQPQYDFDTTIENNTVRVHGQYTAATQQHQNPSGLTEDISEGLCSTCDFFGRCVWQHNNKLTCEHFQ